MQVFEKIHEYEKGSLILKINTNLKTIHGFGKKFTGFGKSSSILNKTSSNSKKFTEFEKEFTKCEKNRIRKKVTDNFKFSLK